MIVIGLITSFNFLAKAFHANILGFVMIGGGTYILLNGIIGVVGGVRESLAGIKTNMYFSIGQLLAGLMMLIFVMISMKKVIYALRITPYVFILGRKTSDGLGSDAR